MTPTLSALHCATCAAQPVLIIAPGTDATHCDLFDAPLLRPVAIIAWCSVTCAAADRRSGWRVAE